MTPGEQKPTAKTEKELTYIEKVWHTVAIVALLVVVILIARVAFNVLLMILSGALIATYFHGLGDLIQRHTKMKRRWAMVISVGGTFLITGSLLWIMGTTIEHQIVQLKITLPHTINNAKAKLAESPTGQQVLDYFSGDDSTTKMFATVQSFFSTGFGVLGDIYIIMFLSIFFTSNPDVYKNGMLMLMPGSKKQLGMNVLDRVSLSLKGWLKGMLLSMVLLVMLLTAGLTVIGIPVALILALFAGMLKIIPNLGSVVAMIPGVLLALTMGTNTAIIVALLYIVSQTIVSNIVLPIVQNRMINLPPALTIISQVIMGTLSGVLGIILAVPLLSIIVILVDELYVKKLGDTEVTAN